jgi:uncharacterized caspase-like protein
MKRHSSICLVLLAILAGVLFCTTGAAATEKRLALVIGNAAYKIKPLTTAVNDAALIAQTLQSAGFDVIGARDLDQGLLRKAIGDFTDKVANAGPGAVVVVYFSGYAGQLAGENYLIPIGADISDVADLPARGSSLSELVHPLAALRSNLTFIVLDAARPGPVVLPGLASGLAWTNPEANTLIAFSSAPGTLARDPVEGYGPYARALAEMIRQGDLGPASLFDRVRLRVHELTKGGQIPWEASKIDIQFKFFERTLGAPPRTDALTRTSQLRLQPMRSLDAQDAYMVALLRDTFDAYTDFLADYWQDPMTKRVRALLAARRESLIWQRTLQVTEPVAYWSYLERYPHGPHVAEAERILKRMAAVITPPSKFARMDYDIPPPSPDELEYIERATLMLDDPAFGFESPPPTPAHFLEPPPQELVNLKPEAAAAPHALPQLNLPVQAFLRITPDEKTSPNPSNNARDPWIMRPAIDVPTGPEKPADSAKIVSSQSQKPGSTNDITNDARAVSSLAGRETPIRNPGPPEASQEMPAIFTSRLTSATMASTAPAWLADIVAAKNQRAFSWTAGDSEGPMGAPSMFASASAGLTLETWRHGMPTSPTTIPAESVRSVAVARSKADLRSAPPGAVVLPQATTGTIPPSTARTAKLTSVTTGSHPKPNANTASPLSISADLPKKPRKPFAPKPAQASRATSTPNEAPEAPSE